MKEELLEDANSVIGRVDSMANSSRVLVNFVVVTALVGLVTKEVNVLEVLALNVSQAVSLVPASGEDIKGDLTTNGVSQAVVGELLLEGLDHGSTDLVGKIELLKLVTLSGGGVTANGGNIDHAVSELNKGTTALGQLDISKVSEDENNKLVVLVFTNPVDKTLGSELLALLVSSETVLREGIIKLIKNISTQLLLLLSEIRATDKANDDLLAELLEHITDLVGDLETGRGQGSVDIKEDEGIGVFTFRERGSSRHCVVYG